MKKRIASKPSDVSRDWNRRAFIRLARQGATSGAVFSALPAICHLAARAQTATGIRVAFISPGQRPTPDHPSPMLNGFQEGLRALGWTENDKLLIEARFAEGQFQRIPEYIAELVWLNVKAICVVGSQAAAAVKQETTIPLVMIGDPVGTKLAASADRPGGTVTGLASVSQELCSKRLKVLKDLEPKLIRAAVVANPDHPAMPGVVRMTRTAAETLRIDLVAVDVRTEKDLEAAFETMIKEKAEGFVYYPVPMSDSRVSQVADIAMQRRLLWSDEVPRNAVLGALVSYGPDYPDLARRAAGYVDKILKGTSPAVLPIGMPTAFELVVNLRTAQGLGLTIPEAVLSEATNVVR